LHVSFLRLIYDEAKPLIGQEQAALSEYPDFCTRAERRAGQQVLALIQMGNIRRIARQTGAVAGAAAGTLAISAMTSCCDAALRPSCGISRRKAGGTGVSPNSEF
jgi:hypothetical protein